MQSTLFKKIGIVSLAASALLLVACSNSQESSKASSSEATSSKQVTSSSSAKDKKTSSSTKVKDRDDDDDVDDDDKDDDDQDEMDAGSSSDEAIESISTYGDYLDAYFAIIEDFGQRYDEIVKGTPAESQAASDAQKQAYSMGYEQAKKSLSGMKDKKLSSDQKAEYVKQLKKFKEDMEDTLESVRQSVR